MNMLNLSDLLKISNINEECLAEARDVFKQKYSGTIFNVFGPLMDGEQREWIVESHQPYENLKYFKTIMDILSKFGDSIQMFVIDFKEIGVSEGRPIIKMLNDKSFQSLTKLSFLNCKGNVLNELKNPYQNVKVFGFSCIEKGYFRIPADDQKLNNIFPNIEYLIVEKTNADDWRFLDGSFEKLIGLTVWLQDTVNQSHVTHFLRNNQQIAHLKIKYPNLKFLNDVNEILPNLRKLEMVSISESYLNYQIDAVHFQHVTELSIETNDGDSFPEKITFDCIEKLSLKNHHHSPEQWTEFIENQVNKNLTSFELYTGSLAPEMLLYFSAELTNLKSVWILSKTQIFAFGIVSFVDRCRNLTKLILITEMDEFQQNTLKQSLISNWDVTFETNIINEIRINVNKYEEILKIFFYFK